MLIIFTGEGKGKTTAALGVAVRTLGWNRRVAMIQFIKGYKQTGEWQFAQKQPNFSIYQSHDVPKAAIGQPQKHHQQACQLAWQKTKEIMKTGGCNLLILDELNNALHYDMLNLTDVIKTLKAYAKKIDIIVTGRDAPPELIKIADIVSEITEIKHPFKKGELARKGIDL